MRLFLFLAFSSVFLHAEDWTAADGTTYKNVKVLGHDDGYVTVLDSDGGGKIPLRLLNADLQKKFGYDAAKAKACEAATDAQDKADRLAVAKEEEAAEAAKQKNLVAMQQAEAAPVSATPAQAPESPAPDAKPKMSDADRQAIQTQIDSLNADISFMQGEEDKLDAQRNLKTGGGHHYGGGGYPDKIRDEQQQIQQLQAQLNGS